jgi:CheY-like chemotaxis protein
MEDNQGPISILIADDDEDDRLLFEDTLNGLQVSSSIDMVENGKKLMESLKSSGGLQLPHLIFIDINMPFKNGLECLKEIRSNSIFDSIPIFMFSTSVSNIDIDKAYELGANRYITKSFFFSSPIPTIELMLSVPWKYYLQKVTLEKFVMSRVEKSTSY